MNPEQVSEAREKLTNLINKARRVMIRVRAVFPFDLFPDTIEVDENKIDIVVWEFFFIKRVFSFLIPDIKAVALTNDIFFASLFFDVRGYEHNPPIIRYLPKNQAVKARRIIVGLMAANRDNIDISQIPGRELAVELEKIGRVREETVFSL